MCAIPPSEAFTGSEILQGIKRKKNNNKKPPELCEIASCIERPAECGRKQWIFSDISAVGVRMFVPKHGQKPTCTQT